MHRPIFGHVAFGLAQSPLFLTSTFSSPVQLVSNQYTRGFLEQQERHKNFKHIIHVNRIFNMDGGAAARFKRLSALLVEKSHKSHGQLMPCV